MEASDMLPVSSEVRGVRERLELSSLSLSHTFDTPANMLALSERRLMALAQTLNVGKVY
jgi:hypothetical protein